MFDRPEDAAKAISDKRTELGFHPSHGASHVSCGSEIQVKTAEQIAAEKKKEWVRKLHKIYLSTTGKNTYQAFEHLYDLLLSGELEAPKGDL